MGLEVKVKICRESTSLCHVFTLPDLRFDEKFNAFATGYKITVHEVSANFTFCGNVALDAVSLNNLLLKINALPPEDFEKVMDLYLLEKPNHLGLLMAYTNASHYEVVSYETANTRDFNELKRRSGVIYFLNLFPDLIIELDAQNAISEDYMELMFREGIRSAAIKLVVDRFYVMDSYLLDTCREEDIDYMEQEEQVCWEMR